MKLRLSLDPEGIPEVYINWVQENPASPELMLTVQALGLSQSELAGTLLDIARTLSNAPSESLNTPAGPPAAPTRFNPQPRARR